jgi:hypothetical protein
MHALKRMYMFEGVELLSAQGHPILTRVAWPSGLRRWFKAPVSSGAWVRIPPLPNTFLCFYKNLFGILTVAFSLTIAVYDVRSNTGTLSFKSVRIFG